jgi:hypothetical protein
VCGRKREKCFVVFLILLKTEFLTVVEKIKEQVMYSGGWLLICSS